MCHLFTNLQSLGRTVEGGRTCRLDSSQLSVLPAWPYTGPRCLAVHSRAGSTHRNLANMQTKLKTDHIHLSGLVT